MSWRKGCEAYTHTLTMLYTYKLQCMMGNSFSYVHTLGRVHPIREQRVHRLEPIGSVYISMMLYRAQWGSESFRFGFQTSYNLLLACTNFTAAVFTCARSFKRLEKFGLYSFRYELAFQ